MLEFVNRTKLMFQKIKKIEINTYTFTYIKNTDVEFEKNLKKWEGFVSKAFHGGSEPDICDISLFGAIQAFSDLKTMKAAVESDSNLIFKKWYTLINQAVGESKTTTYLFLPKIQ